MHLLIDGLGSRVGGGITGLWGLASALPVIAPQNKYSIVLSSAYQSELIKKFSAIMNVIPIKISTNLLIRAYFQNITLNNIIERVNADVVLFSGEGAYFNCRVPSIMISGNLSLFVGKDESALMSRKLLMYKLFRRPIALRSMTHVTRIGFVSSVLKDIVLKIADIHPEKTFLMPHGVSEEFYIDNDANTWRESLGTEPYLLSVSSINQNKGYELLLSAYAELKGDVPRLVIAGPVLHKQTHNNMLDIMRKSCLADRVCLLGNVPHDKLPGLYNGATAFVFPSHLESFGIPLIEAMASGLPIIASDLPVCKEVCDDAALYFDVGNKNGLCRQMTRLLNDVSLHKTLSYKARLRAMKFRWEDTAAEFIKVVSGICP